MTKAIERRGTNPFRKTYSVYLDPRVVAAVDTLVTAGEFTNRSDAVEAACKRLVLVTAAESVNEVAEAA